MTRDDFIGQLEGYLDEYEGMTPLPEGIRDAVRAQLPTTRQIGLLSGPMRYLVIMSKPVQFAIAAAAVLVVAVVGFQLFSGPGTGGPGESGTPQPTSTPVTSEAPSVAPEGLLDPGPFTLWVDEASGLTTMLTVPAADWYGTNAGGILLKNDTADPPKGAGFITWVGELTVYGDPCQWRTTSPDPPTGPTVDDLVTALSAQPMRDATAPVDITVDGFSGRAIELTVPADIDFADCDRGEFRSWTGPDDAARYHQGPGQHDLVWIIDVDGTRVVIDAAFYEGTSAADRAEQQAILDSIDFQ